MLLAHSKTLKAISHYLTAMETTTEPPSTNVTGPIYLDPGVNWWGLGGTIFFYLVVLALGLYASCKKKSYTGDDSEGIMLAGRDLGFVVGLFTMSATWVGGGFINGTAELVFTPGQGLAMCTAPVGYSMSLMISAVFFAGQMRSKGYVTMLDPFKEKFGSVTAAFIYIPCLLGDVCWSGAILHALGASLAVILGIDKIPSILISSGIAVFYTVLGGLYSVIFTDVIQLACIFIGLWLGAGFSMANPVVRSISETVSGPNGWLGHFPTGPEAGLYADNFLLVTLGGIPWQAYLQRVLASRTVFIARLLPFLAGFCCLVLAAPAVLIGAVAASTDWNQTEYRLYRPVPIQEDDYTLILPLVLQYLTPLPVAVIGLGGVSAAVMSSADSSLMSSSSMFAHNIYTPFREALTKKRPSQREIIWSMRVCIIFVGLLASLIAITVNSIYALFVLCGDLVYVMVFPQLVTVIHMPRVNTYGAVTGYIVSTVLRITGGEPLLGIPALIEYPDYDRASGIQYFPYKTVCMLITLVTIPVVSLLVDYLFTKGYLSPKHDVFKCFVKGVDREKKEGFYAGNVASSKSGKRLGDYADLKGESMDLIDKQTTAM